MHRKNKENKQKVFKKIVLRPSLFSHVFLLLLFASTSLLCIYTALYFPSTVQDVVLFGYIIPLPLLGIFPLIFGAVLVMRQFNFKYVIDKDHVRSFTGIISFKLHDKRIDFQNIRGVEIKRSLLDRLFDVGDIAIGSAMRSQDEMIMYGVKNPEYYRDIIERRFKDYV